MPLTVRTQRHYDHRLRELVCKTNSVDLALRHGVPRSTARGWLAPTATPVVTLKGVDHDAIGLRQEVVALRLRVDRLVAMLRLMTLLLKLSGFSLARVRLPDGAAKARLLKPCAASRAEEPQYLPSAEKSARPAGMRALALPCPGVYLVSRNLGGENSRRKVPNIEVVSTAICQTATVLMAIDTPRILASAEAKLSSLFGLLNCSLQERR